VAFGGAGPLHACALAEALGMPTVIVPARAGVLSAVGLLTAPRRRDLVRSWPTPGDHTGLDAARAELADRARALVAAPSGRGDERDDMIEVATALDCRYRGQSHELTVEDLAAFHDEHRRRNGYAQPDDPVEVVALRATATRPPVVDAEALPAPERLAERPERGTDDAHQPREVVGPAVIAEPDCTVWVAEGWVARAGAAGALVLRRTGRA
jgi:N-methylhydantoinase A/oxoprolinase/acetone carboxylase beta subunit